MKLDPIQKTRVALGLNFVALFIIIVAVPHLIRVGTSWASEETIESFFLVVGLTALIYIFRHYDQMVRKREEEARELDYVLRSKERELIDTFQYLGKVNVQISLMRSLFEKMKSIPSSRNQLRKIYVEIIHLASGVVQGRRLFLRIVDIETGRTLNEQEKKEKDKKKKKQIKISNNDLIKAFFRKKPLRNKEYEAFFSKGKESDVKAFIIVPYESKTTCSVKERQFLEAVANQCEILFLLFSVRYYRFNKNNKQLSSKK